MIGAKKRLNDIQPYKQGASSNKVENELIKLSSNELPYPPSPKAIKAYNNINTVLGRYPDGAQTQLRSVLADLHNIPEANIYAGNGSEEAIGLIVRAVLEPGDKIIVSENSFVGAGSVITKNVKKKSLAITRAPQLEVKNYKRKKK
mgnify:CR=1 FL=1